MRCGNRNWSPRAGKVFLLLLIYCSGVLSVACQSKPKDVVSILQPCQELIDKDDILAAGKCYNAALDDYPQMSREVEDAFTKLFFDKCVNLKNKKNYEQSITCFEGLRVLVSDSANINFLLADSYYEYHKAKGFKDFNLLERAETAIAKGLQLKPDDPVAYGLNGQISERKGELRKAVENYRKAVDLAPKDEIYWMKLALTQEKLNDISPALISYYQVLQINPKASLALYNSAKLYEQTGNIEQAIKNFEKLLEIEGRFDDAGERLENLKNKKINRKEKTNRRKSIGELGIAASLHK